eukprot:1159516-Pelagomonas_calceolata.AAC.7
MDQPIPRTADQHGMPQLQDVDTPLVVTAAPSITTLPSTINLVAVPSIIAAGVAKVKTGQASLFDAYLINMHLH